MTARRVVLAVLTTLAFAPELVAIEGKEPGQALYAACQACHESAEAPNRGPSLRGVIDRPAGSVRGFPYSRAIKNARRNWTEANLDAFLANPQTALPGNTMPFPGLPAEEDRRALIAYLKTLR